VVKGGTGGSLLRQRHADDLAILGEVVPRTDEVRHWVRQEPVDGRVHMAHGNPFVALRQLEQPLTDRLRVERMPAGQRIQPFGHPRLETGRPAERLRDQPHRRVGGKIRHLDVLRRIDDGVERGLPQRLQLRRPGEDDEQLVLVGDEVLEPRGEVRVQQVTIQPLVLVEQQDERSVVQRPGDARQIVGEMAGTEPLGRRRRQPHRRVRVER
jgi:hypothetical protein